MAARCQRGREQRPNLDPQNAQNISNLGFQLGVKFVHTELKMEIFFFFSLKYNATFIGFLD